LVAGGDDRGQIVVRDLATGRPVAELNAGRYRVNVLAFGRNPHIGHDGPDPLPACRRWRLAARDAGAQVRVWDLGPAVPLERTIFRQGLSYQVFALAFSPDGSLLASTSRDGASLADPVTGQRLLTVRTGSYPFALAFATDGRRLAVGSE